MVTRKDRCAKAADLIARALRSAGLIVTTESSRQSKSTYLTVYRAPDDDEAVLDIRVSDHRESAYGNPTDVSIRLDMTGQPDGDDVRSLLRRLDLPESAADAFFGQRKKQSETAKVAAVTRDTNRRAVEAEAVQRVVAALRLDQRRHRETRLAQAGRVHPLQIP